jgi:uncharacterized membrane protein
MDQPENEPDKEPENASEGKEAGAAEAAAAAPAQAPAREKALAPEKKTSAGDKPELDPYWWAPWAVLIGLVLYGLLGYVGVLFPVRKGPTAADVPAKTAPTASDQRPLPAR